MKYKHFDDILPNHRTDFVMLYFVACRSLRELKASVHRINNGSPTGIVIDLKSPQGNVFYLMGLAKSTCSGTWPFRRRNRRI